MSETINNKQVFTLLEVTTSIQKTIAERYKSSFWVMAEMNKLNHYPHSGHCYPELVEKKDGKVIAQIKSNLWSSDFQRINTNFLSVLKEPIKDGIKILFCATISFDPSHGLSLRILDIDPSFSLGELERERQETIDRLKREGIFTLNKTLKLPLLPKRIAVISVETSKGYSDYLKIIEHNPWRYKYFNCLFPALLQGDKSVFSILGQLRRIKKVIAHFDVVAIIRGGGGDVGLSSYNNYDLAKEIATFPIPVITGIGHSTNETVAELIAFKNAITPTELADFLIQHFHNFSVPLKKAEEILIDKASRIVTEEKIKFRNSIKYFQSVTNNKLLRSYHEIQGQSVSLSQHSKFLIKSEREAFRLAIQSTKKVSLFLLHTHRREINEIKGKISRNINSNIRSRESLLLSIEKNVNILDPINILRRGFTITLHNGKAMKSYAEVKHGDMITSVLVDGEVVSEVKSDNHER
ncbi:MAG TPA: exodeoxyribonuclease VII large subunit [Chryseolinea sp.]|nr:exodeoxyribonuclease VII large subunit [Chryseolinea sp.]